MKDNNQFKIVKRELKSNIIGEVRFDDGARAMYSTDSSNYRMPPIGVVLPKSRHDIIEIIRISKKYGTPILSRGGGTSLAGQCCNSAMVMDMSKYYKGTIEINVEKKLGKVLPGTVLDDFRKEAKKHGLTFGPDPATHDHCTIGGMLGNNSCGVHSILAEMEGTGARTSDNTYELEIVTYDGLIMKVGKTSEEELERIIHEGGRRGEIYSGLKNIRDKYADLIRAHYPKIPRRVSGYNLDELLPENGFNVARALVGTESTCVTILESTMHLVPHPKVSVLLVLGYNDIYEAGDHAHELLKYQPEGLEGMDDVLIELMKKKNLHVEDLKLLPEGKGWLVVEFGGNTREEADTRAMKVMAELKKENNPPHMKIFDKTKEETKIWDVRESGLGATAFSPGLPDAWEGWEDSAVPPVKVGDYLRDLKKLWNKYGYNSTMYGHFGDGCIHCRINFDLVTADGIKKWRDYLDEAADLVVSYGGSISGEHGDGQSKAELLPKMFGEELVEAFREFKFLWDPEGKMNPGKIVNANPIVSHLRLGADYKPWKPETHFQFPDDHGDFSRASMRCVGVGKCRREEGGTMCPSYMVTFEEEHSTRGRAHMLFELFHGGILEQNWKNEHVKEALDLCLSCKGCKADCPVNVDVATYKSEFLSHYYEGKIKPLHAYAFGVIDRWSKLGSSMPAFSNFMLNTSITKNLLGIHPKRTLPMYAKKNFKDWWKKRQTSLPAGNLGQKKVILWADTFNNFFRPEVAKAAVEVLEYAGFEVVVPMQHLCCGRPLYDYGMLNTAKKYLRKILRELNHEIRESIPIIGLEPSCTAVFKDELTNLFPNDEDAKRLKENVFFFSDFIEKNINDFPFPKLNRRAKLHGHCHQKSIFKLDSELSLLKKLGVEAEELDSGCCGMAGAFGYEKDHYDVSVKCGERILLPEVRKTNDETLIITNGFSCMEQIKQQTNRKAMHLAEVLQMSLRTEIQMT